MKKIISFTAILLMCFLCSKSVSAKGDTVTGLEASGTTTAVTVSGTVNSSASAVMIEVSDSDKNVIIMYSFAVNTERKFSGTINKLTLTRGATYTVKAADYDGGEWYCTTFTVPTQISPVTPSEPQDSVGIPSTSVAIPAQEVSPTPEVTTTLEGKTSIEEKIILEPKYDESTNQIVADITVNQVSKAIDAAKDEVKKQEKENVGITIAFNVVAKNDWNDKPIVANLSQKVQNELLQNQVTEIQFNSEVVSIYMDNKAIESMSEQAKSDISIAITPVDMNEIKKDKNINIKRHSCYNIEVKALDKNVPISTFGKGTIQLEFAYELGKVDTNGNPSKIGTLENPQRVKAVYIDDLGVSSVIKGSYYDAKKKAVIVPLEHLSMYGICYDMSVTKLDTVFRYLNFKGNSGKNKVNLYWKYLDDVDGYIIYGAAEGGKREKFATITGNEMSYTVNNLKAGTNYRFFIRAYKIVNGKRVGYADSKTIFLTTTGGKYGNPKTITCDSTNMSLKVGDTSTVSASYTITKKLKKKVSLFRYESSDNKVAIVDNKGKVTAVGEGECYVYVYMQNGIYRRVKVTVK